jgi:hypothetical protein
MWSALCALGLGSAMTLSACGDDAAQAMPDAIQVRPVAGASAPRISPSQAAPRPLCGRLELASAGDPRLAASVCVGFPDAARVGSSIRCEPASTPDARATGLVFCVITDAKLAYVVQWRSSSEGRALLDQNRFLADVRRVNTNTFDLSYASGDLARCTLNGTRVDFCLSR